MLLFSYSEVNLDQTGQQNCLLSPKHPSPSALKCLDRSPQLLKVQNSSFLTWSCPSQTADTVSLQGCTNELSLTSTYIPPHSYCILEYLLGNLKMTWRRKKIMNKLLKLNAKSCAACRNRVQYSSKQNAGHLKNKGVTIGTL